MSVVAEAQKVKPLQVQIIGKVLRVRRYQKNYFTAIICPAPDVYSRPSIVEIRSKSKFADAQEETKVTAVLGGYEGKAYRVTDDDGVVSMVTPVQHFLDLVE